MAGGQALFAAPPPSRNRPGALNSLRRVRSELAAVYRDARVGRISAAELTRFAYALNVLARLLESEQQEARIEALEQQLEARQWSGGQIRID